ncbi:MAG: hypothetical protein QM654_12980 [Dysgonamonadaceae bacterium]
MILRFHKIPPSYCFLGNPILFEVSGTAYEAIDIAITCAGNTYAQTYYPFLRTDGRYYSLIDVSGFLFKESTIHQYPTGAGYVIPFENHSIAYEVRILQALEVENELGIVTGSEDYVFSGTALPGGINEQLFGMLAENGKTIFDFRLSSKSCNFLFTTRTHSPDIHLRRSEMYPFLFIHPGGTISFLSGKGNSLEADSLSEKTVCLLDIYKVWDDFLSQYNEFASNIAVLVDGLESFRFTIRDSKEEDELYTLRFRNSLGAFEVIEVVGKASNEPEFAEETTYKALTDYNYYETLKDRQGLVNKIKVSTGYKSRDDLLFIRDLICSDEVYFYYRDGSVFRCRVTADKMNFANKLVTPTAVDLVVTEVGSGKFVTPEVTREMLERAGFDFNVFDETFDQTFN